MGEVWFNVKMEMPYSNRRNMNQVKEKTSNRRRRGERGGEATSAGAFEKTPYLRIPPLRRTYRTDLTLIT